MLAADAGPDDYFGFSLAVSGDTAIIGAHNEQTTTFGAAYVFIRSGGTWAQQAKLTPSDYGGAFGESVAISGDTVVIGSRFSDVPGVLAAGAAYVFVRSGNTWTEQAKLVASDAAIGDELGGAVAISGDTIVAGADFVDSPGGGDDERGAAYVFIRSGTVWTQQARLTPGAIDWNVGDQFGISVSVSGDTAIVGSRFGDAPGVQNTGAAFVFVRSGGVWTQQARLNAIDAAAGEFFGCSVALSGDTAIVGSRFDSYGARTGAGSAYVFGRVGTVWAVQGKLTAADAANDDSLGGSVALSGNTATVGAPLDDHVGASNAGSAYVFVRANYTWVQQAKLIASDAATNDNFGESVAIAGDEILTGSLFDDHAAGTNSGSAYVYSANCDDDADGVPNAGDVCPSTTAGISVDFAGRPLRDCNTDCLVNSGDLQCIVDELLGL